MQNIFNKSLNGEFLNMDEAMILYHNAPLATLMSVAHSIRMAIHHQNIVTWQIDRNINSTNVCVSGCKFCNFHCRLSDHDHSYVCTKEQYRQKIDQMFALGGDQILLQGGMHPHLGLDFYEDLFRELKSEYPSLKLNALGAPELFFLAHKAGVSVRDALIRLRRAGLDSLPGAGAEILDNDVRRRISPAKCSADEWLMVMREAHLLGIPTTATMMYGHVETLQNRVEHLFKIRDLQAQTSGFTAFIPWAYQGAGTELSTMGYMGSNNAAQYLRLIAMSRILIPNIENIQASWLTMTIPTALMALHGGANDMGSIMIEENVVSQAGLSNTTLDAARMQQAIISAGFTPALRDQQYNIR